jgi:hypothetical protein
MAKKFRFDIEKPLNEKALDKLPLEAQEGILSNLQKKLEARAEEIKDKLASVQRKRQRYADRF